MFKEWRAAKKLTQEAVAEKLSIDAQFISNIERGLADLPPRHFKKVSKILGISLRQIMREHLRVTEERIRLEHKITSPRIIQ